MSLKLFILFLKVAVGASLLSVEVSFRSLTILNMAFGVCNVKSMRKRLNLHFFLMARKGKLYWLQKEVRLNVSI